jgi:cyclophilin family peptidyl-prolyl cis-trans isomerase
MAAGSSSYDAAVPAPSTGRPRAYLSLSVSGEPIGKVIIELANDVVPQTAGKFLRMCESTGEGSLRNTSFHNITKGCFLGAGEDLGVSTGRFADENFALQYSEAGVVGMANGGLDSNDTQFFISLKALPHLNGRNVAFGKVVEGMDVIVKASNVFSIKGTPLKKIEISECGKMQ